MKCKDCRYRYEKWEDTTLLTKTTGEIIRHIYCNNPECEQYGKETEAFGECYKGESVSDFYIKNERASVFGGQPTVGYIKIADSVFIQVKRKPFIVHRLMMRMLFGWRWVKDWHNEAEE